jgi:hypothetical protein
MELFLFWLFFSVICGIVASSRGRSGFGYSLLAIMISPLLCIILVALLPNLKNSLSSSQPTPETHVKCPDCRELILRDAKKCKHCGAALIPQ